MPSDLGAVRKEVRDSFVLVQVEAEIGVCLLTQPPNKVAVSSNARSQSIIQWRRPHLERGELEQPRIRVIRLLE